MKYAFCIGRVLDLERLGEVFWFFTSPPPLRNECWPLAAGNGPYDKKGLCPGRDGVGQRGIR